VRFIVFSSSILDLKPRCKMILKDEYVKQVMTGKRKTRNDFIEDAIKVHGKKYGYDKVIYVNITTKVSITCLTCDTDFPQTPDHHLRGHGCSTCGHRIQAEKNKKRASAVFVEKAMEVHGKKYGYDKVNYVTSITHVDITCLTCCITFPQIPSSHLLGHGCTNCYLNRKIKREEIMKKESADAFVEKATKIHDGKYGYKNTNYVDYVTHVDITCLKCEKDFPQVPSSHLQGHGCPTCVNKTEGIVASKLQEILEPLGFEIEHMGSRVSKGIGKMDIRITNKDLIIFVEVDGRHHFEYVPQYKSKVLDIQKTDLKKHMRAVERGHRVIRIDQNWVWKSHVKNKTEWASRLHDTIMKPDPSIDEMFLSDKPDKYHDHLCYIQCQV